jgi:hypothetical protein
MNFQEAFSEEKTPYRLKRSVLNLERCDVLFFAEV